MQRDVYLHGELAKFGNHWTINAPMIADAIKLIDCQTVGFKKYLIEAAEAGLEIAMTVDNKRIEEPAELILDNLKGEMHIALMPSGSKRGWGRLILGAILLTVAFMYGTPASATTLKAKLAADMTLGYTMLAALGVNLMMVGLTELLMKAPKHDKEGEAGLFNGPENTLVQGTPVPVCYGELLVGGKPISVNFKPSGGTGHVGGGGGLSGLVAAVSPDYTLYNWVKDLDLKDVEDYLRDYSDE